MKPRILLIDDDPGIRFGFSKYLSKTGYHIIAVSCLAEGKEALISERYDAVLLDLNLPDGSGLPWIDDLRAAQPEIAIVVITGLSDVPTAVEAMHRGADNFLTKPVNLSELDIFLQKSIEVGSLRRRNIVNQRLSRRDTPFFGKSAPSAQAMEMASLAAENESVVLLQGETGTGKGVLARWIHEHSSRRDAPFVEINCSSLKGDLLASELFGHARGAFTGAVQDRQGLIEVADEGTLFLDEIGDMDISVQAHLLKVIEEKRYRRLGEVKVRKSNFRLICATNKDLETESRDGRFRQDLFFRIYIFPITAPPLRELGSDIQGFVRYFLDLLHAARAEISPDAMEALVSYPWPGNVRELRNVLERALLLSRGGPLALDHFPGIRRSAEKERNEPSNRKLKVLESDHIQNILKSVGGDTVKAAAMLGISRATLYRKLKKV
ncbi:MAG TPA: sigma-54 dependent transcriptional regulator [Syntrophorhabdaceae bacterium]|jgi:DNA-binding NtrC family response regulator